MYLQHYRKNIVFGKLVRGEEVLKKIENVEEDECRPAVTVKIINCGEYNEGKSLPLMISSSS